jgi:predicted HTH domain antitoxin
MTLAMQVTLDLPDDISEALAGQWPDLPRQALEALAIEGYRTGGLTEGQVRRLLGLDSRFQVHALLKDHRVPLRYSESDLEDDLRAHTSSGLPRAR